MYQSILAFLTDLGLKPEKREWSLQPPESKLLGGVAEVNSLLAKCSWMRNLQEASGSRAFSAIVRNGQLIMFTTVVLKRTSLSSGKATTSESG